MIWKKNNKRYIYAIDASQTFTSANQIISVS